jgi:hypothetical protein
MRAEYTFGELYEASAGSLYLWGTRPLGFELVAGVQDETSPSFSERRTFSERYSRRFLASVVGYPPLDRRFRRGLASRFSSPTNFRTEST